MVPAEEYERQTAATGTFLQIRLGLLRRNPVLVQHARAFVVTCKKPPFLGVHDLDYRRVD